MLFDIFNKNRLRQEQETRFRLNDKLAAVKKERDILLSQLKIAEQRFERVSYLQNEFDHGSVQCKLEFTKKDIPVFSVIDIEKREIQIFDLDAKQTNAHRALVLWFNFYRKDCISIVDIQGTNSLGHGEIAMNHLLRYARQNGYTKIVGELSPHDKETHGGRLRAFYSKFGFTINFGKPGEFGSISLFVNSIRTVRLIG